MKRPDWGKLFTTVLSEPGKLGEYYQYFHRYSLGNQAWVVEQMKERNLKVGPISTFNGWKKLGRRVRKGEKGLSMWMPIVKIACREDEDSTEEIFFITKNLWFALSQTEPDPYHPYYPGKVPGEGEVAPPWDKEKALRELGIKEVSFLEVDGNIQGYARPANREVAINPIAAFPLKTLFHELAHCLLHEREVLDGQVTANVEEAEAESVAMLCCATLGIPGIEECRGYVQHWLRGSGQEQEFLQRAARVFQAADRILKAGNPEKSLHKGLYENDPVG